MCFAKTQGMIMVANNDNNGNVRLMQPKERLNEQPLLRLGWMRRFIGVTTKKKKIYFLLESDINAKVECLCKVEQPGMNTGGSVCFAIIFHAYMYISSMYKSY